MSEFFAKNKTVLLLAIVGVCGFGAFYFYQQNNVAPANGSQITSDDTTTSQAGAELITIIAKLKSIDLKEDLFSDPVFKSFIDFSQPIPPQPKGGRNPFSPITGAGAAATGAQTAR